MANHSALLNQHTFSSEGVEPSCVNCDATLKDFVEKSCVVPHRYDRVVEHNTTTKQPKVLECACGDRVTVTSIDKP